MAVPGTGLMEAGGVSIAPARWFVPGHAQPVQQLPHRVPVEPHPGMRRTAALHFACSFSSGSAAFAVLDSLSPDGQPEGPGAEAAAVLGNKQPAAHLQEVGSVLVGGEGEAGVAPVAAAAVEVQDGAAYIIVSVVEVAAALDIYAV